MKEQIIFSLIQGGQITYRLIARSDGFFEEQQFAVDKKFTFTASFDRAQMVAMAESILAWDKDNPA